MLKGLHVWVVSTLAFAVCVSLSCVSPGVQSRLRAEREWERNIAIVQASVDGKSSVPITEQDLMAAAIFFDDLTGIPAEINGGSMILAAPTPGTADALVKWRQWHESHKDRLMWDEVNQKVFVVEPK